MRLLKEGQADAFYSAGNSGAMMAAAIFVLDRIEGVHRPAIGAVLPSGGARLWWTPGPADCEAPHLLQFAQLGGVRGARSSACGAPGWDWSATARKRPKATPWCRRRTPSCQRTQLRGQRGGDVTNGLVDVAVCDGFTGNVMLKTAERADLQPGARGGREQAALRLAGAVLRPALRAVARRLDYAEVGGPLIGVQGAVYIGHGRSNQKAIANGIRTAAEAASSELLRRQAASLRNGPHRGLCLPPAG